MWYLRYLAAGFGRWLRVMTAVVVLLLVSGPLGRAAVVHADEGQCVDVMGFQMPEWMVGPEGVSISLAGGVLTGSSSVGVPTTGGAVLTSGVGAAGGMAALTASLLMGAAAVGYGEGACYFLDVLNADKYLIDSVCGLGAFFGFMPGGQFGACDQTPPPNLVGHLGVTYGTQTFGGSCSSNTMSACAYRTFTFDAPIAASGSNQVARVVMPWQTVTQGGVILPESDWSAYDLPAEAWDDFQVRKINGVQSSQHNVYPDPGTVTDRLTGQTSLQIAHRNGLFVDPDGPGPTAATRMNIGGYQGMPPGAVLTTKSANDVHPFTLMAPYYPEVNAQGWYRRYVTDAYCFNPDTEIGTWRRYAGPLFADKGTYTARPSVPRCQVGEAPAVSLVTKVPANVACEVGYVCWPNSEVARVAWPETWITDPPAVVECLRVGNECGEKPTLIVGNPETPDDDECWWGFITLDPEDCLALTPPPGTGIDTGVSTTEVVDVAETPVGDPTSTGTPVDEIVDPKPDPTPTPDPNGVTVVVDVPIDDGGEDAPRVPCPVGSPGDENGPCIPSSEGECWPSGWGWFNPAEWVLKPIKCAMVWAFVPDDLPGWLDEQGDKLDDVVPFSWTVDMVEWLDVATTPVDGLTGCMPGVDLPAVDGEAGSTGDLCFVDADSVAVAMGSTVLQTILWFAMVGMTLLLFVIETVGALL